MSNVVEIYPYPKSLALEKIFWMLYQIINIKIGLAMIRELGTDCLETLNLCCLKY